jgi:prepilin-type N-terminal cleavage/methylation domain-containing protein
MVSPLLILDSLVGIGQSLNVPMPPGRRRGSGRKNAQMKMKTRSLRKQAFTLIEIMIVVAIIAIVCVIGIPSIVRARSSARMNACINNLSQLDAAKSAWANAMRADPATVPAITSIQPFLGRGSTGTMPTCPSDPSNSFATSYSLQAISTLPTCLIMGSSTNKFPHILH